MSAKPFKIIVVGQESIENLRLADLFRKLLGQENVHRYLELRHLIEFLSEEEGYPLAVIIDLFSFDPKDATDTIGYIREKFPKVVFGIHIDNLEFKSRWEELPEDWQARLRHYYRIFKQPDDTELEPIVRQILVYIKSEALQNVGGVVFRMTEVSGEASLPPHFLKNKQGDTSDAVFISYSREDWDSFVSPLVERLRDRGYSVWVDQHLLVGGDDWMDSIGAALDQCKMLILVMSPEALSSKFVKMEYRYFFNHDKPMIPLLYRPVDYVPPELSVTQYIDFSRSDTAPALEHLFKVLDAQFS